MWSALLGGVALWGGWTPLAAAGPEIRATAGFALGVDPSGQKPAAMADALLRTKVAAAPKLRWVEPARVLSGDPKTREEETLERARAALADGRRAYDALALDDAIARLGQAVSLYQRTGPLLSDGNELEAALALLGSALVLRGSADEAESTFVELLTLDPGFQLGEAPPAVDRIFERAVARIDQSPTGEVEIYSTPPYAAVFLDGRFEGVTPLVLTDVVAGTHYLRVEKLGYTMYGAPLQISGGQRVTAQTRLSSLVRGAELRDLAARAVVEADGDGMGGHTRELGRQLLADVLVVVAVHQSGQDATFTGAVYDARTGARTATERAVLSADAQLTEQLGRYLDRLVAAASAEGAEPLPKAEAPASDQPFGLGRDGKTGSAPGTASAQTLVPSRSTSSAEILGWTLVGLGGAAVIGGAVAGGLALDAHDDFRQTSQRSPDLVRLQDRGRTLGTTADVLYVSGGAVLVAGAALVVWSGLERGPVRAGVAPTDGGAMVGAWGQF